MAMKSIMTYNQRKALRKMGQVLNDNINVHAPVYQGETVPGASDLQQQGFDAADGSLGYRQDPRASISSMLNETYDPAATAQRFQTQVGDPANVQFGRTMDSLGERYGSTYGQSGGMMRGMGQAASDFNTSLTSQLAQFQNTEKNRVQDFNSQGVGLGIADEQARQGSLEHLMGLGQEQRNIQTQQNQAAMGNWEAQQPYNNPWLQTLTGPVLGTQANMYVQEPNTFGQITGAIGGLGQIFGSTQGGGIG